MTRRILSREELIKHRDQHVEFIKASAASFDHGFTGEAKRIAVSLRVLLHQTARSHSILAQLRERQREMIDTSAPYNPNNLLTHHGLVAIKIGTTANFVALLGDTPVLPRRTDFTVWWDADIVLKDAGGSTFTRKQLVLFAANKDGGAHVDPHLDEKFEHLQSGMSAGWRFSSAGTETPLTDVISHSIRQIGHEVMVTLTGTAS